MQKNVLEYLEKSVNLFPNKIFVSDEKKQYTYLEFSNRAKYIATNIIKFTESINKPIAVFVDRNADSLLAFMSVLYSGNFYVPIDCKMPIERIKSVIEQVDPILIIDASIDNKDNKIDEILMQFTNCKIFKLDAQEFEYSIDKIDKIENELIYSRLRKILDIDPVYVIFTSGSTGTPKGIVISHRSVIDFTDWMSDTFDFSENDIMGNQAPFYFDLSVKDIYTSIKHGASLVILPKKVFMLPTILVNYLNEKNVTSLIWATSAFNLLSSSKVFEKKKLNTVNKVILGGEMLLAKHLNNWKKAMPNIKYVNLYGPTEVTVDCTYYIIDREFEDSEAIPIGKACENKEVLLLDENHEREVKKGEVGEICVRGTGLAKGYFNDVEKTNKAFIQNPLNKNYEDKIYCTGDLGYKNKNDEIVFASRKDGQIKHMGYRIELGEIEKAVNSFNKINAAICFYDDNKKKIVCAYEGDALDKEIVMHILNIIPKYMYPNIFKKYEVLPYNANGKIDRVKLKKEYFDE